MEWAELVASGDLPTILIVVVLVIITGGVGAAIVNGITASRRGIKGDALVKEQNGIEGLGKLADSQGAYIETLEKRLDKVEADFNMKVENLERKLESEVAYSNILINVLSENTIPIPPRPPRKSN